MQGTNLHYRVLCLAQGHFNWVRRSLAQTCNPSVAKQDLYLLRHPAEIFTTCAQMNNTDSLFYNTKVLNNHFCYFSNGLIMSN